MFVSFLGNLENDFGSFVGSREKESLGIVS